MTVVKNALVLIGGRAILLVGSFIFIVYAARELGVTDFGRYALVRALYELFLSLSVGALGTVLTRNIAKDTDAAGLYLGISLLPGMVMTVLGIGVLVAVAHVSGYDTTTVYAIYLTCVALIPGAIGKLLEGGFLGVEKAEYIATGDSVELVVRTVLSVIALYLNYGVITLFVIQIGSNIVMVVVYLVAWNLKTTRLQVRFDWPLIKQMLRDWRTFALEGWTYDLFSKFDNLALSVLLGEAAVGVYNAAFRVIGVAQIFARSFTRASFPYLARLYETSIDRFRAISEKSLRYMVALVLPGVVSLFILAHRFILLLFDRSYTASIPVFQVMVWVLLFRFVNSYLSFMLFAQGKQQRSLHVILIASVVYVPVTLVFVPTWGVVGMAMALLVSQGVAFVWYLAFAVSVPRVPTVLLSFARAALPSVGVGVLVWFLRPYPLAVITLVSIALYAVLFMALHIPDSEDIAVVRDLSVRAWHKTNARLRLVGGQ